MKVSEILEQRQGEIAHGVGAQVRRHEAQADLSVRRPRRGLAQGLLGRPGLGQARPDAMLFQKLVAVIQRLDLGQLLQERGVAIGFGPGPPERGEVTERLCAFESCKTVSLTGNRDVLTGAGRDEQEDAAVWSAFVKLSC